MTTKKLKNKVLLSMPHMSGNELNYVEEAFSSNWVAPMGPNVSGFETDVESYLGVKKAVAMSSGTAAIHIGLELLGVGSGDSVFVSSLTFIASVNPVLYQKATPVFIDSEPESWNMSPQALEKAFIVAEKKGKRPKAVIAVDLFGMPANYKALLDICDRYDVPLLADSAESLGSSYQNKKCGSLGKMGVLSFNGNKIITTGGGGMLVSDDEALMEKALFLITQARDPAPYYQHTQMGYNYRMSNVLAGIGRGQMTVLDKRVERRREIYQNYVTGLEGSGLIFCEEPSESFSNRWLSTTFLKKEETRSSLELNNFLNKMNIESRPIWKPMHLQPLFESCEYMAHEGWSEAESDVASYIFEKGLCLPSASNYDDDTYAEVIEVVKNWLEE